MRGFRQQHRKMARTLGKRLLTAMLLLLVIAMARGVWGVYQKERAAVENRQQAEAELAELQKRERELQEELARLQTERGKEAELRQQFEVAKEGEKLIVVVDREEEGAERPEPQEPLWRSLWPW